jgi:predicted RNase H-like nuclease (RuvC/YqgF family)
MFAVIVEPEKGERGFTERKVGMYECPQCHTKFPTVVSRQHYLIIGAEQLKQIQEEVKSLHQDNSDLKQKLEEMSREQDNLHTAIENVRKEGEVKRLEAKLEQLAQHVEYLRKEKGELEQKVSKPR